jgi:hypothetical protein
MKTERLSPKTRATIAEMTSLLDRWKFAGVVLLSEATKVHKMTGCCRFDMDPPQPCLGFSALEKSVSKYIRETEAILSERPY